MNYLPLLFVFVSAIIYTIGDIYLKIWVTTTSLKFYWIGCIIYIIGTQITLQTMKYRPIQIVGILGVLLNTIFFTLYSYYAYDEQLKMTQLIGIGLSIIAMIIMEL